MSFCISTTTGRIHAFGFFLAFGSRQSPCGSPLTKHVARYTSIYVYIYVYMYI